MFYCLKEADYLIKRWLKKYFLIPVPVRAGIWFVICALLQKAVSFLTVPIFTRLMSKGDYGIFSTYMSVYNIMVVVCTLSMERCIYINLLTKASDEKEKDNASIELLSLAGLVTIFLFFLYLILHKYIDNLLGLPFELICLMFIHILFEPAITFFSTRQRFEYKYIAMVVLTMIMVISNTTLGILFVTIFRSNQGTARIVSVVLSEAVVGSVLYGYFYIKARKIFSVRGWKHALGVQLPLLPHNLSLVILSSSDRIMINLIVGPEQAAIYSVAYSAGYIVNTLKVNIASALTPWFYGKLKEKDFQSIKEISKILLVLIAFISCGFMSLAPEVIRIMAPKSYYEAIYVIPPVAASTYFTFLYSLFSTISFYCEKSKLIMLASTFSAVSNLIMNAIFIPIFGYIAAAYTTLICYLLLSLAHYMIMKAECKKTLKMKVPFDIRFSAFLGVCVLLFTVMISFLYSNLIMRYIVMIAIVTIMLKKRNLFINAIKQLKRKSENK